MTYEEFEKSLVVEPTYDTTGEMVSIELRFQACVRQHLNEYCIVAPEAVDTMREFVIERLKREFYKRLLGLYALVDEFGMTEDEFVRWCRYKFYSDKNRRLA